MNGNKKVLSLSARRSAKAAESAVPLRFSGKGVVAFIYTRLSDYSQLIKLRLTLLVVFSAGIGLVLADVHAVNANDLLILLLSGFLITGSANGINQVIERKPDKLMARTLNRPVATGRLSVREAIVVTTLIGMSGAVLLGVYANPLSALTGVASLLLYAFVYTPLKRYTPLSVVA
ncbi:MAG: UbiA family prenyltransferase, partial [Flavobacteriales bacterium]